jgi:ABC-type Fe3+/spermidine/putrescine transport system ATPase subunit
MSRGASMSAQPVPDLQLLRLTKRYGGVLAVDDVSLDVAPGEFVTLLGPSGCGKTTLLKSIAGFLQPSEGQVVLHQTVINDVLPHLRQIGIVFQNYALFPHMTVAQNIGFGLRMRGRTRSEIDRVAAEMLELVKLPGLAGRYPHQLSGGQQQRVALARVLAVKPVLLLLDEPFGALDKKLRIEMQIEVKQLVSELRMTTIFVTHDQEEAMLMSDRIAVMRSGCIVQCDTPQAIYDRPHDLFVADFIGASNLLEARVLDTVGAAARVAAGGAELEVSVASGSPPAAVGDAPDDGHAVLLIRPENLALGATAEMDGWTGRVTFALHAGPTMEYEVAVGEGARLRVSRPRAGGGGERTFAIGDDVGVSVVDPSSCRLFRGSRG